MTHGIEEGLDLEEPTNDRASWKISVRSWPNTLKDPFEAPLDLWRLATARLRTLPDLVILGAQRAGTTSLYQYLTDHPLFVPPITKEIHYLDRHANRSQTWYRANFPIGAYNRLIELRHGHRPVTGEATPGYLFHPAAAERMARFDADPSVDGAPKFVAVLRDPVDRAYSHYHHTRRAGWEPLPFEQALEAEDLRLAGQFDMHRDDPDHVDPIFFRYSYKARGRYAEQLERWFDRFDRDRFLILSSQKLFDDPDATVRRVTDFLDLPPMQIEAPEPYNEASYEAMDPDVRERLEAEFEPHDRRLAKLLDREPPWASPVAIPA